MVIHSFVFPIIIIFFGIIYQSSYLSISASRRCLIFLCAPEGLLCSMGGSGSAWWNWKDAINDWLAWLLLGARGGWKRNTFRRWIGRKKGWNAHAIRKSSRRGWACLADEPPVWPWTFPSALCSAAAPWAVKKPTDTPKSCPKALIGTRNFRRQRWWDGFITNTHSQLTDKDRPTIGWPRGVWSEKETLEKHPWCENHESYTKTRLKVSLFGSNWTIKNRRRPWRCFGKNRLETDRREGRKKRLDCAEKIEEGWLYKEVGQKRLENRGKSRWKN